MSRAYHWVAEVHKAMRTVVGDGLKQQLQAPQEVPPDIASLVAQIDAPHARVRLSMPDDRVPHSRFP